jgi:hypothetical protein
VVRVPVAVTESSAALVTVVTLAINSVVSVRAHKHPVPHKNAYKSYLKVFPHSEHALLSVSGCSGRFTVFSVTGGVAALSDTTSPFMLICPSIGSTVHSAYYSEITGAQNSTYEHLVDDGETSVLHFQV